MSRCSRLEALVSRKERAGRSPAELRGQNISGVTDAAAETGMAAGLVPQSSGRLMKELRSLRDKHSTLAAGVRAA